MSKLFLEVFKVITPFKPQVRCLPRWNHRRPVGVIAPEEYDKNQDKRIKIAPEEYNKNQDKRIKVAPEEYDKTQDKRIFAQRKETPTDTQWKTKINWRQPNRKATLTDDAQTDSEQKELKYKTKRDRFIKPLTIAHPKVSYKAKAKTVDMLETVIDAEGNFVYTKMNNNDPRISSILVEVKSKKEKEKKDLILLEGKRLIKDALEAGCTLKYILFSRLDDLEYLKPYLPKIGAKLYKMPYREMQIWSDLSTNPGLMGIFKVPDTEITTDSSDQLPLTVICDNVREPNNLGSILRTCSGVGCKEVILTKGCVNVWETKVLRSAMGAHFKLHIKKKLSWDDIRANILPNSAVYIADNQVVSTSSETSSDNLGNLLQTVPILPYYGVDFGRDRHVVLIIGGETEGISEESYKFAFDFNGIRLNVPLSNNIDSLNTGTALGIIAFEMKRQLSRLIEERKESTG